MTLKKNAGRIAAVSALAGLLAACGGGGSSGPTYTVTIQDTTLQTTGDAPTGVNVGVSDRIAITCH